MDRKHLQIVMGYLLATGVTYYILHRFGIIIISPSSENLLSWDAYFFKRIIDVGFEFKPNTGTNLAFFPFFSLLWQTLDFSTIEVSLFNTLLFAFCFTALIKSEHVRTSFVLFVLSIPTFIFFAVPYSESLFFAFGTLLIIAYRSDSRYLKACAFFGISMVKAVSVIIIPTLILSEILTRDSRRPLGRKILDIFINSAASLTGLLLVAWLQAYQTGKWFYFIGIQKYWGRHWLIPKFPLTTTNAKNILFIDGIAFTLGVIALYVCIRLSCNLFRRNLPSANHRHSVDTAVVFSVIYLAATVILDTFFTTNSKGSTSIWSLNRHFLCSPFFTVFICWLYKSFTPTTKEAIFILVLILTGVYFTGVYQYLSMTILYLNFFIALIFYKLNSRYYLIFYVSILMQFMYQILFYQDFLLGQWIG